MDRYTELVSRVCRRRGAALQRHPAGRRRGDHRAAGRSPAPLSTASLAISPGPGCPGPASSRSSWRARTTQVPGLQRSGGRAVPTGCVLAPAHRRGRAQLRGVQPLVRQPAAAARHRSVPGAAALEALPTARGTGAVTISEAYVLMKDRGLPVGEQQMSFLITTPVFQPTGGSGCTLRGWVADGGARPRLPRRHHREPTRRARSPPCSTTTVGGRTSRSSRSASPRTRVRSDPAAHPARRSARVGAHRAPHRRGCSARPTGGMDSLTLGRRVVITLLLTALVAILTGTRNRAMARVDAGHGRAARRHRPPAGGRGPAARARGRAAASRPARPAHRARQPGRPGRRAGAAAAPRRAGIGAAADRPGRLQADQRRVRARRRRPGAHRVQPAAARRRTRRRPAARIGGDEFVVLLTDIAGPERRRRGGPADPGRGRRHPVRLGEDTAAGPGQHRRHHRPPRRRPQGAAAPRRRRHVPGQAGRHPQLALHDPSMTDRRAARRRPGRRPRRRPATAASSTSSTSRSSTSPTAGRSPSRRCCAGSTRGTA